MLTQSWTRPVLRPTSRVRRLGLVTTYPPTPCGIGKFSNSLVRALAIGAPEIDIEVVRLIEEGPATPGIGDSVLQIVPDLPIGIRAVARRLNQCDVVVIQHEYGIYGANDGEAILDLIHRIRRPTIAVLHTVLSDPSYRQKRILEELAARCRIVAVSESARELLLSHYSVDPSNVTMIPHGAAWSARLPNRPPRRELITWGLLGPGKGLERAISALPALRHLDPLPRYRIVGRTHPTVIKKSGRTYRTSLETLVTDLGVDDMVEFVDTFLSDTELEEMVTVADLVVLPYDNNNQVSSGVLTEAVAAGRPVVATRFPHAVELLADGAGVTVEHDSQAIAQAVLRLLTDPDAYLSCVSTASARSAELSWERCALEYARLADLVFNEQTKAESADA